jgi:XTP/dITP diphosphohydrolase
MTEIWLATTNKGKIDEVKSLMAAHAVTIKSISDMGTYAIPKETGSSFEENARIKAQSLRALKENSWVLGEDSGLECDGLGGLPGLYSARYAGERASDAENVAKLLKMLKIRTQNRRARFRCALVAYAPDGQEHLFEGTLEGEVTQQPRGKYGFGYDPIFVAEGQTQTLAELGPGFKNKVSHRAQAIRQFAKLLSGG